MFRTSSIFLSMGGWGSKRYGFHQVRSSAAWKQDRLTELAENRARRSEVLRLVSAMLDPLMKARSSRRLGSTLVGLGAIVLIAAIALNQNAVRAESGVLNDAASFPLGLAAVLALGGCLLCIRAWFGTKGLGITLPSVFVVLMVLVAAFGALVVVAQPVFFNGGNAVCLDANTPAPGQCGYQIPDSDFTRFYAASLVALVAAALGIASLAFMLRGRVRR